MRIILSIIFCGLLGIMIGAYGFKAILWFPSGYVFGLFVTAQIILPLVLGLPKAFNLVREGKMNAGVFKRIIRAPIVWLIILIISGYLWPNVANFLYNNEPLNFGASFGTLSIMLSPFSKKCRQDFNEDFDKAYNEFYTNVNTTYFGNS